jgi:nucleoid-associated protein YgaU
MDKDKLAENTNTIESLEQHYAKIYSDLPEEVVKMLIRTHPLYGKDKELIKDEEPSEDKKTQASVASEHNPSRSILKQQVDEKTQDEQEIEAQEDEQEIEEDEELEEDEEWEDDEEVEEDEEKAFLSSLFSKHNAVEWKVAVKKYLVLAIGAGLVLVFGISTLGKNIKNKQSIAELQNENFLLSGKLEKIEVEKQQLLDRNSDLTNELEKIRQSGEMLPSQAQTKNSTVPETAKVPTTVAAKKTYTVVAGDSFWKISMKLYGSGKYYLDIMKANNIKKEADIYEGMVLNLPDIKGGN